MSLRKALGSAVVAAALVATAACARTTDSGARTTDSGASTTDRGASTTDRGARTTDSGDQPTGKVHGSVVLTGGMSGAKPDTTAGTVVAKRKGKRIAQQSVATGQQFSFDLPAGEYELSVGDAGLPCVTATVTVTAGGDQSVSVPCPRK